MKPLTTPLALKLYAPTLAVPLWYAGLLSRGDIEVPLDSLSERFVCLLADSICSATSRVVAVVAPAQTAPLAHTSEQAGLLRGVRLARRS